MKGKKLLKADRTSIDAEAALQGKVTDFQHKSFSQIGGTGPLFFPKRMQILTHNQVSNY